ncbi:MAG: hypothetical protein KAW12_04230, partial [Candidatus Aminicenantes bacterium]|nr:hypothetical protein [Candidatus Aminicenantes bacterium]
WSSNRGGNWSIRHIAGAELSGSGGVHQPGIIERDALTVIDNLYSQRTPLPIPGKTGERVSLLYRSSRGPTGRTAARSAVETLDFRSAGSTVVNDRIPHRLGQQDTYTDFLHYSYDTGQPGEPLDSGTRSSYDTVGLFLTPTADDLHMINRNQELIKGMLERFIPILSRVVFIIEPPLYVDKYQYRTREGEERIIHRFTDDFSGPYPVQTYPAQITDTAAVPVIDWQWLKSWDGQHPLHLTVDTRVSPVETCYRSLQTGLNEQAGA